MVRCLMEGQRSILDLGGSIGIKYYAFKKQIQDWPGYSWVVHDVPAAVERGRRFAKERGEDGPLSFVDEFDQGEGVDVLFASGVLQYLPRTLGEMLSGWKKLPPRIIINITPIHEEREFFTVNSIGTAFCPYRVQTQSGLMSGLTRLGYKLRALWQNEGKTMRIPFRPDLYLAAYSGYCLDLVETAKNVVNVL
jgi:putative methyltransferase (TIGR04325 family)